MAIVINGSGTVTGISVGGLPDGIVDAGTLATDSVDSAELIDGAIDDSHMAAMAASKLTGALPAISGASLTGITTGKVLQVVSVNKTDIFTSNAVAVDVTGLAATITPAATSSKILIQVEIEYDNQVRNGGGGFTLRRNPSTLLAQPTGSTGSRYVVATGMHSGHNSDQTMMHTSINYLDSPSTTSAMTYQVAIVTGDSASETSVNCSKTDANEGDDPRSTSTITLMEIGA